MFNRNYSNDHEKLYEKYRKQVGALPVQGLNLVDNQLNNTLYGNMSAERSVNSQMDRAYNTLENKYFKDNVSNLHNQDLANKYYRQSLGTGSSVYGVEQRGRADMDRGFDKQRTLLGKKYQGLGDEYYNKYMELIKGDKWQNSLAYNRDQVDTSLFDNFMASVSQLEAEKKSREEIYKYISSFKDMEWDKDSKIQYENLLQKYTDPWEIFYDKYAQFLKDYSSYGLPTK